MELARENPQRGDQGAPNGDAPEQYLLGGRLLLHRLFHREQNEHPFRHRRDTGETVGQETSQENEAPLTEEEKLAQELEKANEQIEEQKDKYLRLSAEFDNYRKRTMKEKAELILNGGEKSISSILPIVDDFERALKNMETATDVAAVKEGVELIYNNEALKGKILDCVQTGYILNDKVIRHAKVVVGE